MNNRPAWSVGVGPHDDRPAADTQRLECRIETDPHDHQFYTHAVNGSTVVVAGTLFNLPELTARLGAPDRSNPAVAIGHGFQRHRNDLWRMLEGYFSIVIWDGGDQTLHCVRDPSGAQPLFFAAGSDFLIASPDIPTLLDNARVSRTLNRTTMVDYLCRRWVDGEATFFSDIKRVMPGHVLHWSQHRIDQARYWDPLSAQPVTAAIDDAISMRFIELVGNCVDSSIPDNGQVGVFLSGGLDSTALAIALSDRAARAGQPPPVALSVDFPPPYGESATQRGIASALNLPHVQFDLQDAITSNGVLRSGVELSRQLPAPLTNIWAPAFLRLAEAARDRGCHTLLTGEGADEWMSVPPTYAADLIRRGDVGSLFALWRMYKNFYPAVRWSSLRRLLIDFAAKPIVRRWFSSSHRRIARPILPEDWIAPEAELRRAVLDPARASTLQHQTTTPTPYYRDDHYRHLHDPLPWMRAEEVFCTARNVGVQIREPFICAQIAQFLSGVSPAASIRRGVPKALLRDFVAARLPAMGFEHQQKQLLGNLIQSITAAEKSDALKDFGMSWVLDDLGVVDAKQMLPSLGGSNGSNGWRIWDVINLESWAQAWH